MGLDWEISTVRNVGLAYLNSAYVHATRDLATVIRNPCIRVARDLPTAPRKTVRPVSARKRRLIEAGSATRPTT